MTYRKITAKDKNGITRTLSRSAWARELNKPVSSVTKTFRRLEATMNDQEMVDYIRLEGTKWDKPDSIRKPEKSQSSLARRESEVLDICSDAARKFLYPIRQTVV